VGSKEDAASFLASAGLGRSGYLYVSIDVIPRNDGSFSGRLTAFSGNRFNIQYEAAHRSAQWVREWIGTMEGKQVRRDYVASKWDVLAEREWGMETTEVERNPS
jgi:hypothetical protein